ncbi:MAG: ABC transporter permease [Thermoanaerobaculia bacterium]
MSPREAMASAFESLGGHKLRSGLTMLGMIFGVGAVIAMLSIGAGAERQALEMVELLGLRNVLVRSVELEDPERTELRKKSPGVAPRDAEAIAGAVPGVELTAQRIEVEPYTVLAAGASTDAEVFGVSHHVGGLLELDLSEGRFLDALDEAEHAQVSVIGHRVRRDLFGFGPAVGEVLKVDDVWLRVVGVLAPGPGAGSTIEGVSVGGTGGQILLPVSTARRKFDHDPLASPLDEIIVRLAPGTASGAAAEAIRGILERLHAGARDYELVVPEALLAQAQRTQRLFNLVMGAIAGISLLVGGIGIMNIMLATVLERTREIGVRRAVGARQRDIRFQFVVESFAISLVGGLAGIVAGLGLAWGVAAWAGWETVVTPGTVLLATGVAVAVGLASGIYPAHRAAALHPIEALRYE